ncbi:MAG: ComEC/Rec2 family competence protein [Patescibacteria group bacterium]
MKFLKRNFLIYLTVILLFVNLGFLIYFLFFSEQSIRSENFKIIFLNVGQGDAILIRTPQGKNILIDGGPDINIIYKLDRYIPFYKRRIDLMVLTHPDPDHLTGLVEVLKRYKVEQVFYNGVKDPDSIYSAFLEEIEKKKIKKEVVWIGKKFFLENSQLEILYPLKNLSGQSFKNDNEASIVLKLIIGKIKILLTGDATKKVEDELIKNDTDLKAEILKVAHHGSKDSTSLEFLKEVKPIYAVISVGKNKFGHPSLRVLRNLEKIGAKILRTDQLGDIIFEINRFKENIQIKCQFNNCDINPYGVSNF